MSMLNIRVVVFLLLVTFTRQGSAQSSLCSRDTGCANTFNEDSVRDCCVQEGVLSVIPAGDEVCRLCYVYGWVQDIAPDNDSASPQSDITAEEGETIILHIFHTKNGGSPPGGFGFNIEAGGNATLNEDYTLPNTSFTLFREPIPISITLEKDGVAGEGLETITLTLIQTFGTEDDRIILEYRTVVINLQDIDDLPRIMLKTENVEVVENRGLVEVCLMLSRPTPTALNVNVTSIASGSATGGDDFVVETLTAMFAANSDTACVEFTVVDDMIALEGDETFTVTFTTPPAIVPGSPSAATVTIIDDDGLLLRLKGKKFIPNDGEVNITDLPVGGCRRYESLECLSDVPYRGRVDKAYWVYTDPITLNEIRVDDIRCKVHRKCQSSDIGWWSARDIYRKGKSYFGVLSLGRAFEEAAVGVFTCHYEESAVSVNIIANYSAPTPISPTPPHPVSETLTPSPSPDPPTPHDTHVPYPETTTQPILPSPNPTVSYDPVDPTYLFPSDSPSP